MFTMSGQFLYLDITSVTIIGHYCISYLAINNNVVQNILRFYEYDSTINRL